jgi:predicted phosphohydrolase
VCCYGHLHGASHRRALQGDRGGTAFYMVSGDYLGFHPKKICD